MLIAIDYDGTYTLDKIFWNDFIVMSRKSGHEIICPTMRYQSEPILDMDCKIIYTGRKAKIAYLLGLGIVPNIWIDDNPNWFYFDAV